MSWILQTYDVLENISDYDYEYNKKIKIRQNHLTFLSVY